ncbi:hypothetical protein [Deinococcus arenicola]|uniref:PsbP C-terminal domain-containing protein n=1 Tax=Deinococcus arenicola TaxID=2994950 RepID=A0ABU4DQG0_9DEIO|nr:hypothetical protein [Deinococcus sp. ZS9-10]MDV6374667.1 hypothetical protein [Deinococcus sp. ZS9-10]
MKATHLFAVAALALGSTLATAGAQTLTPFSDPKLPFKVSLPQGWLGVDFDDGISGLSMVSAKAPPATLIRLLFSPKQDAPADLNAEFGKFVEALRSSGVTVKQLSNAKATYGGIGGIERQYSVTHPKGQLNVRVWYGNDAKNLYSFQLTDSAARYAAASTTFSKILATVQF